MIFIELFFAQNLKHFRYFLYFDISIVGVWYIMWDNIGRVKENQRDMEFIPDARRDSINSVDGTPINEALLVYADCHSTTKGLFAGIEFSSYLKSVHNFNSKILLKMYS